MHLPASPLLLALCALFHPPAAPARADVDLLYRRVMTRALDRAQERLADTLDLVQDRSSWDDPWVVDSEHYSVRTTVSRAVAKAVADGLELMLPRFQYVLGTEHVPAQRFPVYVYPSIAEYNQRGQNAAEHSSFYGSYLDGDGSVVAVYRANETELGMFVTHSALHQYAASAFGSNAPIWMAEGLASYFALFWDWNWAFDQFERLSGTPTFVPLQTVVRSTAGDFMPDGTARLLELGMLFHYLLNVREDTRDGADEPFLDYLRARFRGERAPGSRFDARSLAEMQTDFVDASYR